MPYKPIDFNLKLTYKLVKVNIPKESDVGKQNMHDMNELSSYV